MSGIRQVGRTGEIADVNTAGEQLVVLPNVHERVGSIRSHSENDSGELTGDPYLKSAETSRDYRLRVGIDTMLHYDEFNATSHNTTNNRHVFVGMTATQAGGAMLLNANSNLTAANGVQHTTWRQFPIIDTAPLYTNDTLSFTAAPLANQVVEFGLFPHGTGIAAPTDGVYFRYTSAGLFGVLNYNGVETSSAAFPIPGGTIPANDTRKYTIVPGEKAVEFWMDDKLLGEVVVPAANGKFCLSGALPKSIQFRNTGTVTGAPVMQAKLNDWSVSLADIATNKTWAGQMASMGLSAYQGQNGGTIGQTAQWANTALPTAAAGTNTTAALGTGLGGIFQLNAPATSATDVIISSFANPVGGVNQTPRTLILRGVWIHAANAGAAVATTPTTYALACAFGHTALTLATTETASFATATAKAPRRMPLGIMSFPVGAPIGAIANAVQVDFEAPVVVNPGEFVAIVAKILTGTATASQVTQFVIGFNGYWE
jgi:hypothetical protein